MSTTFDLFALGTALESASDPGILLETGKAQLDSLACDDHYAAFLDTLKLCQLHETVVSSDEGWEQLVQLEDMIVESGLFGEWSGDPITIFDPTEVFSQASKMTEILSEHIKGLHNDQIKDSIKLLRIDSTVNVTMKKTWDW